MRLRTINRLWMSLIAASVMLAFNPAADGAETRGIWWWTSPDHAWGSGQVIGNPTKEAEVLQFMTTWKIGCIYTCFSKQAISKPELIHGWNERLHAAGKSSQLLLSENTWIEPENRPNLLTTHIQRELIDSNNAAKTPRQRFDALHLDIEPHGLPGWKEMTPEARKNLLFQLRDTLREVRSYLDNHGAKEIPIFADLPVWFDQVGKPVGWISEAERDAWFADLSRSLGGISLMAYERDSARGIESGVSWEVAQFKNDVRIGLEVSVGPGKTWKSKDALLSMIETQETTSPPRKVDIHDLVQFHDAVATKPD